jgi:hypothetical protein
MMPRKKPKVIRSTKISLNSVAKRYQWAMQTTSILADWTRYFGDPTCAVLMMLIHEEQFKVILLNNGYYRLADPYSVRAMSKRTSIPAATIHRKLKHMFSFPIFQVEDGYFGFSEDEDGSYIVAKELPNVVRCIDKIIELGKSDELL